MGVVFFPSLPFMGVVLFPSLRLGNAPGEGGVSLTLLSVPYSSSSSFLPLLFSFLPSPSPSFPSLFLLLQLFFFILSFHSPLSLSSKLFCPLFLPSPLSLRFIFLLCLLLPSSALFFFFEGTTCTVCFQGVGDDAIDCNPIVIQL